jgi:hypothetical protein
VASGLERREGLCRQIGHDDGFATVAKNIARWNARAGSRPAIRSISQSVGQPASLEYPVVRFRLGCARLVDPEMTGRHRWRPSDRHTEQNRSLPKNTKSGPQLCVQTDLTGHIHQTPVPEVMIRLGRRPSVAVPLKGERPQQSSLKRGLVDALSGINGENSLS